MNTISGKALHAETGLGIPNLTIIVYDLDPETAGNLEETFAGGDTPASDNPNTNLDFWNRVRGDRLGSVFTGRDGSFTLQYEDEDFRLRNQQERRPDLMLVALAPDRPDATGLETPPWARVVYRSTVIIANAGRTETFIFKLSSAVLEARGIPLPLEGPPAPAAQEDAQQFEQTLGRTLQLRQNIKGVYSGYILDQLEVSQDRSLEASRFVANLMKARVPTRQNPLFVLSPNRLNRALNARLESGLARQQAYGSRASGEVQLSLNEISRFLPAVTDSQLEALERGESVLLSAPYAQWCGFLRQNNGSPALARQQSLWEAILEKYRSEDDLEAVLEGTPEPPVSEETPPPPLTLEQEIREMLSRQLRALEDHSPLLNGRSEEEQLADLQQKVARFRLSAGPTDTTSYHDFYTLQIAFDHIWKEAFDERFKDRVSELYEEVVSIREDYGLGGLPALDALRDVNDYNDFISEVSREIKNIDLGLLPPEVTAALPALSAGDWYRLSESQQMTLLRLSEKWQRVQGSLERLATQEDNGLVRFLEEVNERESARLQTLMEQVVAHPQGRLSRVQELLLELGQRIAEPYAFDLFYPNTVNVGLLATYRQKWVPQDYQVGSLVATIPLAPGETRKYAKKLTKKNARTEKELTKSQFSRSDESSFTSRAQGEITKRAATATNFQLSAEGSFQFGIGSASTQSTFGLNQQQESAQAKRSFREAVAKASQEYRDEHQIEISTSSATDLESTSSGEIKNANNEITVTYLFYELERQYRISEHLHRMTPVILVAQDVPAPHEIDEEWLLSHEWILRRVLLDDSFNEALDYLADGLAGSEIALATRKEYLEKQEALVEKLETSFDEQLALRDTLMEALRTTSAAEGMARSRKKKRKIRRIGQAIFTGGASIVTPGPDMFDGTEASAEVLKANREAIEQRLELLQEELPALKEDLNKSITTLERATKDYTETLTENFRKRGLVGQLRVHVKQNVLYYMQAIWEHEPPDQRYFRLYDVDVSLPVPAGWGDGPDDDGPVEVELGLGTPDILRRLLDRESPRISFRLAPPSPTLQTRKLHQVADLDRPLGYKGNYIIFPLRTCTYLTDFMMQEYVDNYLGLRDPDAAIGDFPDKESLLAFAERIYQREDLTGEEREALRGILVRRLSSARKEDELIVVPTGQLFIEALPGAKPLLENFKLKHRQLDVEKARADVLRAGLENLRYLERLNADLLGDPEVEKQIIVRDGDGELDLDIDS